MKSLKKYLKNNVSWYKYSLYLLFVLSFSSCGNDTLDKKTTVVQKNLVALVMTDGLYGYINTQGKFVIEPQYSLARTFSDGVACVNIAKEEEGALKNGEIGGKNQFININNKIQFNDFSSSSPMSFNNGVAIIQNDDKTFNLMNKAGKIVAENFTTLGDCEDGLIPAVLNQKIGYLNLDGQWQIELPFKYFIGPYNEGLSCFSDVDKRLKGYFNTKGEVAIQAQFKSANNFMDGLARVQKEDTYFFITPNGEKAFDKEFVYTSNFSEGLCALESVGQWGFIDKNGELAIPYQDLEGVRDFSEGMVAFKKEGKVGFMNKEGEMVIPATFDNALPFKNGFAIIEKAGKFGFIDMEGKIVIPAKYERAGNFVDPNMSNAILKVN